jgi:hypothetical protein
LRAASRPSGGAECLQANVVAARFAQARRQDVFREARAAREWDGANIGEELEASRAERVDNLRLDRALVADGEDLHGLQMGGERRHRHAGRRGR